MAFALLKEEKVTPTKLLALSLEKAKQLNITKALIVCDEVNTASEKTIYITAGFVMRDFIEEDGNVVRRFWIEL